MQSHLMRASHTSRWRQSFFLLVALVVQPSISSLQSTGPTAQVSSTSLPAQFQSTNLPAHIPSSGVPARILQRGLPTQVPLTPTLPHDDPISPSNFGSMKPTSGKNLPALPELLSLVRGKRNTKHKKPVSDSLLSFISSLEEESDGSSDESGVVKAYASDNTSLPLLALSDPVVTRKASSEAGLLGKITFRNNSHPIFRSPFVASATHKQNRTSVETDLQKPFLLSTRDSRTRQVDSPGRYSHRRLWPDFQVPKKHEEFSSLTEVSSDETPVTSSLEVLSDETPVKPSLTEVLFDETPVKSSLTKVLSDKTPVKLSLEVLSDETPVKGPLRVEYQSINERLLRAVSALSALHPSLKTGLNLNSFEKDEETPNSFERFQKTSNDIGASPPDNISSADAKKSHDLLKILQSQQHGKLTSSETVHFSKNQPLLPKFGDDGESEDAVEVENQPHRSNFTGVASNVMNHIINSTNANESLKPFSSVKRMLDLIGKSKLSKTRLSHNSTSSEQKANASASDEITTARPPVLTRLQSPSLKLPEELFAETEQLPQHLPLISEPLSRNGKNIETSNRFLNPEASVFGSGENVNVQDELYDHDSVSYDDYYAYDTEYIDNSEETEDENFPSRVSGSEKHETSDGSESIESEISVFHKASDPNVLAEHPLSGQSVSKTKEDARQHSFAPNVNDSGLHSKLVRNSHSEKFFPTEGSITNVHEDTKSYHHFSTGVTPNGEDSLLSYSSFDHTTVGDKLPTSTRPSSEYHRSPVTATSRSMIADALIFGNKQRNPKNLDSDDISIKKLQKFELPDTTEEIDDNAYSVNEKDIPNYSLHKSNSRTSDNTSLNGLAAPSLPRSKVKDEHKTKFRASPSTDDPSSFTPSLYDGHGWGDSPENKLSTSVPLINHVTTMPREIFRERTNAADLIDGNVAHVTRDDFLDFPLLPFNVTRKPIFSASSPTSTYSRGEYIYPYSLPDPPSPNAIIFSTPSSKINHFSTRSPRFHHFSTPLPKMNHFSTPSPRINHFSTPSPRMNHFSTSGTITQPYLPSQSGSTNKPTTLQQLLLSGYTLNPSVSSLTYHELDSLPTHHSEFGNLASDTRPPPPKLLPPPGVGRNPHFARQSQTGSSGLWNYPINRQRPLNKFPVTPLVGTTPPSLVHLPTQLPQNFLSNDVLYVGNNKPIYDNILSYQPSIDTHNVNHGRSFGHVPDSSHATFSGRQISSHGKSILEHNPPSNLISSYTSYPGQASPVTGKSVQMHSPVSHNPQPPVEQFSNSQNVSHGNSFPKTSPIIVDVSHSHVTHLSPVHQILQNPFTSPFSKEPIALKIPGLLSGKKNFSHGFHEGTTFSSIHASQQIPGHSFNKGISSSTHHSNSSPQLQVFVSPLQHFGPTVPHLTFKTISGHYPGQDLLPHVYEYLYPTASPVGQRGKSSLSSLPGNVLPPPSVVEPLPVKNLKEIIIDEKGRLIEETFYVDNIEGGESDEQIPGNFLLSEVSLGNDSNSSLTTTANVNVDPFSKASFPSQRVTDNLVHNTNSEQELSQKKASTQEKNLLEVVGKEGTFTTKNFIEGFISVTPLGEQDEPGSEAPPRVDLSAIGNLLRPSGSLPEPDEISVFTTVREALRGITSDPTYLTFPEERSRSTLSDLQALSLINMLKDPLIATQELPGSSKSHEFVLIVTDARSRVPPRFGNVTFKVPSSSANGSGATSNGGSGEKVKLVDILNKINGTTDVQSLSFSSSHVFKGHLDLDSPSFRGGSDIPKSISNQVSSTLDVGTQNAVSIVDAISFLETSFGSIRNDSLQLLLSRFSDASQLLHLDTPVYIWRPGPGNAFGIRLLDDMHFIIPSTSTSSEFSPQSTTATPVDGGIDNNLRSHVHEQFFIPNNEAISAKPALNSSDKDEYELDDRNLSNDFDADFEDSIPSFSFEETSSEGKKDATTDASVSISTVSVVVPAVADNFIRELKKLFIFSESGELVNSPSTESSQIKKKKLKGDHDMSLIVKNFPEEFQNSRTLAKLLNSINPTSPTKILLEEDSHLGGREANFIESIDPVGQFGDKITDSGKETDVSDGLEELGAVNPNLGKVATTISSIRFDNSGDVINFSDIRKQSEEFIGISTTQLPHTPETTPDIITGSNVFVASDTMNHELTTNAQSLANVLAKSSMNRQPRVHNFESSLLSSSGFVEILNDPQPPDNNAASRILNTTAFDHSAIIHQSIMNDARTNPVDVRVNAFSEPANRFQPPAVTTQTDSSGLQSPPSTLGDNSQRRPQVTLSKVLIPQEPILLLSDDAETEFYFPESVTILNQDTASPSNAHMAPFPIFNERLLHEASSMVSSKTEFPNPSVVSLPLTSIRRLGEHTKRSQNSEIDGLHSTEQHASTRAGTQNIDESEYISNESQKIQQASSVASTSTESRLATQALDLLHSGSNFAHSILSTTQSSTFSIPSSTRAPPNFNTTVHYSSTIPGRDFQKQVMMIDADRLGSEENSTPLHKNLSLPMTKNTLLFISNSLKDKTGPLTEMISEAVKIVKNASLDKSSATGLFTNTLFPWKPEYTSTAGAETSRKPAKILTEKTSSVWKPNIPPLLIPQSGAVEKKSPSSLFWNRDQRRIFLTDAESIGKSNKSVEVDSKGFTDFGGMIRTEEDDGSDAPPFGGTGRMGEGPFIPVHGPYETESAQRKLTQEQIELLLLRRHLLENRADKRTTSTVGESSVKLNSRKRLAEKRVPNGVESTRIKTSRNDHSNYELFGPLEHRNEREGLSYRSFETSLKTKVGHSDSSRSRGTFQNIHDKKIDPPRNSGWTWFSK